MFSTKTSYFLDFSYCSTTLFFGDMICFIHILFNFEFYFLTNVTPDVTLVELWIMKVVYLIF